MNTKSQIENQERENYRAMIMMLRDFLKARQFESDNGLVKCRSCQEPQELGCTELCPYNNLLEAADETLQA